ncbi:MAG: hypothetical protein HQK84_11870 [Nitrospinae bacterium]|nr:hypothetical protein [Nitrospinota bacterium]
MKSLFVYLFALMLSLAAAAGEVHAEAKSDAACPYAGISAGQKCGDKSFRKQLLEESKRLDVSGPTDELARDKIECWKIVIQDISAKHTDSTFQEFESDFNQSECEKYIHCAQNKCNK